MSDAPRKPENLRDLVGETMSGIAEETALAAAAEKRDLELRARGAARRRIAALMLVPACLLLTALNLAGSRWLGGADVPSREEARVGARQVLADAVEELQLYFEEHGAYPQVPGFVGPDGPDGEDEPFGYERVAADRYLLSVTIQGETVRYDSRDDPAGVLREAQRGR